MGKFRRFCPARIRSPRRRRPRFAAFRWAARYART